MTTALAQERGLVPPEYVLFQFCREFKKLPHEVQDMPPAQFALWLDFLRAEAKAGTIREERARQKQLVKSLTSP